MRSGKVGRPDRPLRGAGLAGRVPARPAGEPHHRRQDLLGAGQHPPGQPDLVRPARRSPSSASPRRRRPGPSSSPRPRRSRRRAIPRWPSVRSGPRSTCWRPCCSASSGADGYTGLWNGADELAQRRRSSRRWTRSSRCWSTPTSARPPPTGSRSSTGSSSGSAVYAVMGDWSYSYLAGTKKLAWQVEYAAAVSPGSQGSSTSSPTRSPSRPAPGTPSWPASG